VAFERVVVLREDSGAREKVELTREQLLHLEEVEGQMVLAGQNGDAWKVVDLLIRPHPF